MWAACMCLIVCAIISLTDWMITVLDPRISYEGMKIDYADDPMLSEHLEQSKSNLFNYFYENYAHTVSLHHHQWILRVHPFKLNLLWVPLRNPSRLDIAGKRSHLSMSSKNISNFLLKISMCAIQFTGGWVDELSSQTCFALLVIFYVYLVSHSRYLQIFNTSSSHLCSAVAVKQVFSGGRDTISLRRASLNADTIHILMLVKKRLHLACAKATAALHRCT